MLCTLKTNLLLSFLFSTINIATSQTKFAVIGDFGSGTADEENVSALINGWGVDFIISVGDNFYGAMDSNYFYSWNAIDDNIGQYFSGWIGNYLGNYGSGSIGNKFFPVPGNHDWYHIDSIKVYTDYFTLPGAGFSNSSGNERYYDFVWGNIHFFMLDNYGDELTEYTFPRHGNYGEPDNISANSTQANWFYTQIDNCVNNHAVHWRIVIAHHPPYSSGSSHGSSPVVQWNYKSHGAHIVISGHDHIYERLVINGLTYIVNGLGGRNLRSFINTVSGSQVQYNGNYGAMLFETIGETQLRGQFINTDGIQQDDFTINDSALPIELAYFSGIINGNNVELYWRTETEINNYGFDIERTKNNSDWLTIGFVEGHGNSNSPKQYHFTDDKINQTGKYFYRLKQIDNDGTYEFSDVVSVEIVVPNNFFLSQNYPNPFNPETRIDFTLPEKQLVSLRIYNTLGELVKELVNEQREAGSYSVTFDASNMPGGVYIYRLQTSSFSSSRKLILLK